MRGISTREVDYCTHVVGDHRLQQTTEVDSDHYSIMVAAVYLVNFPVEIIDFY